MDDVDVLESVLTKDQTLIGAVGPRQLSAPTACPDYDVRVLLNHLVGWLPVFEAGANGRSFDGDPGGFVSDEPASDFQRAAAGLVAGWRQGGVDRTVRMSSAELPGQMVLAMTLMEYLTHECDLALATGQAVPFSNAEIGLVLERARATLPDQYRGEDKAFGYIIEVPEDAPVLDRFLGFMGRQGTVR